MNAPCYQCQRRQGSCHDSCSDYLEYRQTINGINSARKSDVRMVDMIYDRNQRIRKDRYNIVKGG
jgi:hypothetical protein